MPISIPAFFSYLLLIGLALNCAQIRAGVPNCTDPTLAWTFNSLKQSPCFVWASLEAVCFGSFGVAALSPGHSYTGPNVTTADGDLCNCNTVVYSLVSACAACQKGGWITYSSWLTNCSDRTEHAGVFPKPVPAGIRVPHWAYLTSFIGKSDSWNLTAAKAAGDNPETTGTSTIANTSRSTLLPTTSLSGPSHSSSTFLPTASLSGSPSTPSHTPSLSSSPSTLPHTPSLSGSPLTLLPTDLRSGPSPTLTSYTGSKHGTTEGSIIGAIVGATLVSGVVAWFIVRRRRARFAPSLTDTRGEMEQPTHYPLTIESPRIYDPLDPTTYLRTEDPRLSNRHLDTSSLQPNRYSGVPGV